MNNRMLKKLTAYAIWSATIGLALPVFSVSGTELQKVIDIAHELDPELKRSELNQIALEHESKGKSYWQDPRVSLVFANIPVESLELDKEPMTQVILGVTQMLPRGGRLKLQREQLFERSKVESSIREQRKAESTRDITILWLDAYREQEKIRIIEKNRKFFEQLSELSSASYISTRGKTRQQHLIRTELEIMKLDEKLQRFSQNRDRSIQVLSTWLLSGDDSDSGVEIEELDNPQLQYDAEVVDMNGESIQDIISLHPEIKSIEQIMRAAKKAIALSRENGKAAWGLNAKYGYREGAREDFFSLGVSVDIPINRNRQNQQVVSAATQRHASIKQKRRGVSRKLQSHFQQFQSQIKHLEIRQQHYQDNILSQMRVEAESAQNAYISDEGDFIEVIRALISEINAELEELDIDIQRQKYIAKLDYLLIGKAS